MSEGVSHRVSRVCALIITFQPDLEALDRLVGAVAGQVGCLLVFDNASAASTTQAYLAALEAEGIAVHRSERNVGLGAAMNHGARFARASGFDSLLILDQDSVPSPDMVETLEIALSELGREGQVAAVGPQFQDPRSGQLAPFLRIGFPLNHKMYGGPGERLRCDFLISSGTLLRLDTLDIVGELDETLFIDNVDLEWCQRAGAKDMALYGVCDARMQHSIGDALQSSRFSREGWTVHRPVRLYYIMRNRTLLYRRQATPVIWILQDIPRLLLKFALTLGVCTPRRSYLQHMLRGIGDGVRGRTGPMQQHGKSRPNDA